MLVSRSFIEVCVWDGLRRQGGIGKENPERARAFAVNK
jgi:hypothetical protein